MFFTHTGKSFASLAPMKSEKKDQTVHTHVRELQKRFRMHGKVWEDGEKSGVTPSHYLLLFYANECMLKARFLEKNQLTTTRDFKTYFEGRGKYGYEHDLIGWIRELGEPPQASRFKLKQKDIKLAHQKFRYGKKVSDEQKEFLKMLYTELKKL